MIQEKRLEKVEREGQWRWRGTEGGADINCREGRTTAGPCECEREIKIRERARERD